MTDQFTAYVDEWDLIKAKIEQLEKQLKPLKADEMTRRKAIAARIAEAMHIKEGVNKYPLPDGRVLKYTHKIDRKIDEPAIAATREEYRKQNDTGGVTFDALLRVKYELSKRDFDKLPEAAALVASRMIVSKDAAPSLEFD